MAATIKDIRRVTGLSLSTISKYLNGGNVRPENRERIEKAVRDLNYEVNETARSLVTRRSRTIGVIVYSIESLFAGILLHHISTFFRQHGYATVICDSGEDEAAEKEHVHFLLSKHVDGIIVIPCSSSADFLQEAREHDVPVVMLDRMIRGADIDSVTVDNRTAAARAADILADNGHRKIAFIGSSWELTGIERCEGFTDALRRRDIPVPARYQKRGRHSIEFGHKSMEELLALSDPPTAVFMTNYEITLGAVMALNEAGRKCPEDVSRVRFRLICCCRTWCGRSCSVVVQPMQELAEESAELLLRRISGEETGAPRQIVLGTQIQEGTSIRKI